MCGEAAVAATVASYWRNVYVFLEFWRLWCCCLSCKCCYFLERSWTTALCHSILNTQSVKATPKRPMHQTSYYITLWVRLFYWEFRKKTQKILSTNLSVAQFELRCIEEAEILMWKTNRSMFVVLFHLCTLNTNTSKFRRKLPFNCWQMSTSIANSCSVWNLCDSCACTQLQTSQFSNNSVDILARAAQ